MAPSRKPAAVPQARHVSPVTYAIFFGAFALILFTAHAAYLKLPYFWDELGQFVPASLDILRDGALVPHSAVPNVHPPGVMAWLALVWKLAGYSIPATRCAMLLLAATGVLFSFLLAIRLCGDTRGFPAFLAILFLLADPLFYTQSMMAQLDMPAMVFTAAGLLLFLDGRHRMAALVCTVLVLSKETGILLPVLCGLSLATSRRRERESAYYLAPFVALAAWLIWLHHTTGFWLGDTGFAHYNIAYSLQPIHAATSLLRRIYFLGFANLRWIGTIAIGIGWRRGLFRSRAWRFTWLFIAAHVLLVSLLGGAELERYLLPVLPLLYTAAAAALTVYRRRWRNISAAALAIGLIAGLLINPPYPFPYENNLAMADFVALHQAAAKFLEREYPREQIYTAWP
ncbi:MAG: glycosyltransferase family 39 protein, partial [Acidobacteriaceae bacterium]|nr:glycosyltransferase family 39 protein [Acidobacteriaceae bacterium]